MARKKVKKKVSSVTQGKRKSVHEQNSMLLIAGGGLLVILFISFYLGLFSFGKTQSLRENVVESVDAASKETVVTIQNNTFSSPVIVKKGTTVTWMNNDASDHSVVSDDGSFEVGIVTPEEPKSYVFDTPGTYSYHCGIHEGMEGTVIVE